MGVGQQLYCEHFLPVLHVNALLGLNCSASGRDWGNPR